MSGIITGPYFKEYFGEPSAGELGLMVSVLEIGAFSTLSKIRWHTAILLFRFDAPQSPRLLPGASATRSAAGAPYSLARWFSLLEGQSKPSPGVSPAW